MSIFDGLKRRPVEAVPMRDIRARFAVPDGDLHDWGGAYGMAEICPLAVHRVAVLADGTVAAVVGFEGDHGPVESALAGDETVVEYSVTAERDGLFLVQFEPRDVVRNLLEARRQTALTMRMPMYLDADGSATGTFLGDEGAFADTLAHMPETAEVEVLSIRDAYATAASVFDRLTDRQREVLDAAVAADYHDDPRGTTHAELAADLDVSPTTVSEHLRRIERRVFGAYQSES